MIPLYAIAGIVVLVWGTLFVSRGSLVVGCLALVIVAACFGHNFLHFDVGSLPMTLDRIVAGVLIGAYLVQRRLGRADPKPLGRGDLVLMLLMGTLVVSTVWGGWGKGITPKFEPLVRLVSGYLIPLAVFWIARQTPLDRRNVSLVHGTLACFGVYLAATGLLEVTGQWWAVFPKHIADPDLGEHFGRARGPMVQSINYGLCLGCCLLAAWLWRWRFGRVGQLILVGLMPLMLAGIYVSYTRSVWLGAGLGALTVLGLTLRGSWRPLVLGTIVSSALAVGVTQMDKLVAFRREYSAAQTAESVNVRGSFVYLSWQMFLDRPLWGVGFGQFPQAKLAYLSDRTSAVNLEATRRYVHHNMFLSVLTETGLIGFALFLAVLAGWGQMGWRLFRGRDVPDWARAHGALLLGALAVYVCQAAFHELSYTPIDNSLLFLLAGTAAGLRTLIQPATLPSGTRQGVAGWAPPATT